MLQCSRKSQRISPIWLQRPVTWTSPWRCRPSSRMMCSMISWCPTTVRWTWCRPTTRRPPPTAVLMTLSSPTARTAAIRRPTINSLFRLFRSVLHSPDWIVAVKQIICVFAESGQRQSAVVVQSGFCLGRTDGRRRPDAQGAVYSHVLGRNALAIPRQSRPHMVRAVSVGQAAGHTKDATAIPRLDRKQ